MVRHCRVDPLRVGREGGSAGAARARWGEGEGSVHYWSAKTEVITLNDALVRSDELNFVNPHIEAGGNYWRNDNVTTGWDSE